MCPQHLSFVTGEYLLEPNGSKVLVPLHFWPGRHSSYKAVSYTCRYASGVWWMTDRSWRMPTVLPHLCCLGLSHSKLRIQGRKVLVALRMLWLVFHSLFFPRPPSFPFLPIQHPMFPFLLGFLCTHNVRAIPWWSCAAHPGAHSPLSSSSTLTCTTPSTRRGLRCEGRTCVTTWIRQIHVAHGDWTRPNRIGSDGGDVAHVQPGGRQHQQHWLGERT